LGPLVSLKHRDHLQDQSTGYAQNVWLIQKVHDFVGRKPAWSLE
jgi:hypothetical protein